ncbi:MAG: hypothetical protein HOD60_00795, partial [Candidatus Nitrosopelagicus sp.]|nr:hypothetical protein [Candidatus Nitrosopelagicus sp.]
MSVQVSYKNQFLVFIFLFFIFIGVIEGYSKIWWEMVETCAFEDSAIYQDVSASMKRQMCTELYQIQFSSERIEPDQNFETISINSYGFRGSEITLEKPQNTFRIFTVGGSTMMGSGSTSDVTTIPGFLQHSFDEVIFNPNIQVINAGISGAWSNTETNLIKNKLLKFKPDLIIVYDGWNDATIGSENPDIMMDSWKNRWEEICLLGNDMGFDVIITIQPMVGTGKKPLTENEYVHYLDLQSTEVLSNLDLLAKKLTELESSCTSTNDLRNAFDEVDSEIFWDVGHMGNAGNKIIAQKMFEIVLPYVPQNTSQTPNNFQLDSEVDSLKNLSEKDSYVQIKRSILSNYKTPLMLKYYFFTNDIAVHDKDVNVNWQIPNIAQTDSLKDFNYSFSYLPNANFSYKTIDEVNFVGSYLRQSTFDNALIYQSNFTSSNLSNTDFSNAKLVNSNFRNADMSGSLLENIILEGVRLEGTDFTNSNLRNSTLTGINLSLSEIQGADFQNSDLSYSDLSGHDFRRVFLMGSNLNYSNLQGTIIEPRNFLNVTMIGTNLSGSTISEGKFDGLD